MPQLTGNETYFKGDYGWSELLNVLPTDTNASENCGSWLLFAPYAHPMWQYHVLYVVKLREVPGAPPVQLAFPGANHEVGVLALNPEYQPYTPEGYCALMRKPDRDFSPWLMPHDACEQFECTDEEAKLLGLYSAWGCANGFLVPDSDYRSSWLPALTKTLAHIRGEEHAK